MDTINSKNKKNFTKKKSIRETLMKDNTESYEDKIDSFQQNNKSDNINIKDIKILKDIINDSPFNLKINKSSDFHIQNSLTFGGNKIGQINYDIGPINNNININNEDEETNR